MRSVFYCILFLSGLLLSCTRHTGPDYVMPPPPFLHLPTLSTAAISNVTNSTASCGGDVTDDGGTAITAKGVCWNTTPGATIAMPTKTIDGAGTGPFSSNLAGLTTGATYYVRAYATNSLGTAYGNEVGFVATTQPTLAVLATLNAVGITSSSASCGGEITSEGNVAVTARGICWGITGNPTMADNYTAVGSGPGIFSASITGLIPSTTYHVRAYAINSVGTAYGNDISFTTSNNVPPPPSTVTICSQVWMTGNLDVVTYRNGDTIPYVSDPVQWATLTTGAWTYTNNDPATNNNYGKLYNWYAVNDPRGLAPAGWHIPSKTEFTTLANCLGGEYIAGGPLKTTGTSNWSTPNTGATNASGFSALPGGKRLVNGSYGNFGYQATFWTSTELSTSNAWNLFLYFSSASCSFANASKSEGASVRCVKD